MTPRIKNQSEGINYKTGVSTVNHAMSQPLKVLMAEKQYFQNKGLNQRLKLLVLIS